MISPNPPSDPITARYDLTVHDYADWLEYRDKPKRKPNAKVLLKQIILALGFTVLIAIALRSPKHEENPAPLWLTIVLAVIAFGGALYSQFRSATANHRREALRTAEAQQPVTLQDIKLTASETRLTVQRGTGMERFTWDQIERIYFAKEHRIFIDIAGGDGLIVPNSAFETKTLAQSFYDHAVEYWRNAHGKIIRTI